MESLSEQEQNWVSNDRENTSFCRAAVINVENFMFSHTRAGQSNGYRKKLD